MSVRRSSRPALAVAASLTLFAAVSSPQALPADEALNAKVDAVLAAGQPRMIGWRRDLHQNPELSNREFRTSKIVADHLQRLGFARCDDSLKLLIQFHQLVVMLVRQAIYLRDLRIRRSNFCIARGNL